MIAAVINHKSKRRIFAGGPIQSLERKTLSKLCEEDERILGGRSHEELVLFTENGH
jgi:hypothetical protein